MKRLIVVAVVGVVLLVMTLVSSVVIFGIIALSGQVVAAAQRPPNLCIPPGTGELPIEVPDPMNSIFTDAANYYDVDPFTLAIVYNIENWQDEDYSWRVPPPPYGDGAPWPTSIAHANGPFQIILPTWLAYNRSNPTGEPGDILDLSDASYAAAHYLRDLGAESGTPFGDYLNPDKEGTIVHALASYNAGPAGNFQNPETREYLRRANELYELVFANAPEPEPDPLPTPESEVESKALAQEPPIEVVPQPIDPCGNDVVALAIEAAKAQIGTPCLWGADDPGAGFDCSGLMRYAYGQAGVDLVGNSSTLYLDGHKVESVELIPGDLVFWDDGSRPGAATHVAMYIGNDEIIEATTWGDEVRINPMRYGADFVGVTRPVPNPVVTPPTEGYPNTDHLACAYGEDVGVVTTAKENRIRLCSINGLVVNVSAEQQFFLIEAQMRQRGHDMTGYGFRTMYQQIGLRELHCGPSYYDIWLKAAHLCSPPTAIPGESRHEQGDAADYQGIYSHGQQIFQDLMEVAPPLGICNLPSEPWHWDPTQCAKYDRAVVQSGDFTGETAGFSGLPEGPDGIIVSSTRISSKSRKT